MYITGHVLKRQAPNINFRAGHVKVYERALLLVINNSNSNRKPGKKINGKP